MKTIFACGDIHEDIPSFEAFLKYVTGQGNVDGIFVDGDFNLMQLDKNDLIQYYGSEGLCGPLLAEVTYHRSTEMIRAFDGLLKKTGIPYFGVPGNYDPSLEGAFANDLHRKTAMFGEAKVYGYGGAVQTPPHIELLTKLGKQIKLETIVEFNEKALAEDLEKEQPNVLLLHAPPHKLCDVTHEGKHWGTEAVEKYLFDHGADLIICGHVHEAGPLGNNPKYVRGIAAREHPETGKRTAVVNPGNLGRFALFYSAPPASLTNEWPEDQPRLLDVKKNDFDFGTFSKIEMTDAGVPMKVTHYKLTLKDEKLDDVDVLASI